MNKKEWWDSIPPEAQILLNLACVYVDASNRFDEVVATQNLPRFVARGGSVDDLCRNVMKRHSELRSAVAEYQKATR